MQEFEICLLEAETMEPVLIGTTLNDIQIPDQVEDTEKVFEIQDISFTFTITDDMIVRRPKKERKKRIFAYKSKLKPYDKRRLFKAKSYWPRIRSNPE